MEASHTFTLLFMLITSASHTEFTQGHALGTTVTKVTVNSTKAAEIYPFLLSLKVILTISPPSVLTHCVITDINVGYLLPVFGEGDSGRVEKLVPGAFRGTGPRDG